MGDELVESGIDAVTEEWEIGTPTKYYEVGTGTTSGAETYAAFVPA